MVLYFLQPGAIYYSTSFLSHELCHQLRDAVVVARGGELCSTFQKKINIAKLTGRPDNYFRQF